MSAIFSNRSVFPNVVNLKLAVKCSEGERVPSDRAGKTSIPFSLLLHIRDFTLTVSNFAVQPPADDARIPPLRSLNFENCASLLRSWIRDVLKQLENQGELGSLETLSVENCALFRNLDVDCRSIATGTIIDYLEAEMHSNAYHSHFVGGAVVGRPGGYDYWAYGGP